ncbi:hypothetical protein EW146_g117 [Bondarzewia mesenterica]|uniref:Uncharacterized protein n=1 Tax=Bondarzewia mesenterica TaxID=1095465 RepID=A0A4S4M840_9AGAM|nr:hypothetical protein EW146_g117 [Bondarzewia mesenterica]
MSERFVQSAMLSTPPQTRPRRPSLHIHPSSSQSLHTLSDIYSDARTHGYQGPIRTVRLPRATPSGNGALSKSEDGTRCVVAGRECLRILRISPSSSTLTPDHKSSVGLGGHRIDASRNLWKGGTVKIDNVTTDVVWGRSTFDQKIITSARSGALIMWDLNKMGASKFDGDLRVWDLRDMSKSIARIHHPTSVRAVSFSPDSHNPVQAVVGLDNGSIYRWDLKMAQRGQLDRVPVAHSGPILSLDWCIGPITPTQGVASSTFSSMASVRGWLVSGGLDRTVKVWDMTTPSHNSHISHVPAYTLSTSFPVRRVLWRPGYECEVAIVSNWEFGAGSNQDMTASGSENGGEVEMDTVVRAPHRGAGDCGDPVEIWDVRRGCIAKWVVGGSAVEGGVMGVFAPEDIAFGDSHALWVQHSSGTFAQLDLRNSTRPLDSIPRMAATWDVTGSLAFVSDKKARWEVPYDDIDPAKKQSLTEGKNKPKALGDGPYKPMTQFFGTYGFDQPSGDLEAFEGTATGYIYEGATKSAICGTNAEVAHQHNRVHAAQTWLLLQSLLTPTTPTPLQSRPPTPPLSPLPLMYPTFPHSLSAPAAIPSTGGVHASPSSLHPPTRASTSDLPPPPPRNSPGHSPRRGTPPLRSSPSNSPSPHRVPSVFALSITASPESLNTPSTSRPTSIFPRRSSNSSLLDQRPRAFSSFRRPSISSPSSSIPLSDSIGSLSSAPINLRHVGEGALDDSDSSSGSGTSGKSVGETMTSADRERRVPLAVTPINLAFTRLQGGAPHPSPLSRVAGQQTWTEDEHEDGQDDEDDSPSPCSTDTEPHSSEEDGSTRLVLAKMASNVQRSKSRSQTRSRGTSIIRAKTRSRNSTVADSAPMLIQPQAPPLLEKQNSKTSVRTVTVEDTSSKGHEHEAGRMSEERLSLRGLGVGIDGSPGQGKLGTAGAVEGSLLGMSLVRGRRVRNDSMQEQRLKEDIRQQEERLYDVGWKAARAALEGYAEEGDMQMCAMMSLVAQDCLEVSNQRLVAFVESYIELLTRLRLHTSAAYMRKHVPAEEVRATTKLQTTVIAQFARIAKAILLNAQSATFQCGPCFFSALYVHMADTKIVIDDTTHSNPCSRFQYLHHHRQVRLVHGDAHYLDLGPRWWTKKSPKIISRFFEPLQLNQTSSQSPMSIVGIAEVLPVTLHKNVYPTIDPQIHYDAQTFKGKVVFITGASRGIGEETATQFAHAGASLVLVARNHTTLDTVKAAILNVVPKASVLTFAADVTHTKEVEQAIKTTIDTFGRLDILIANAGVTRPLEKPFAQDDPDSWWYTLEVNVRGVYNAVHFAVPHLQRTRGYVIVLSSEVGQLRLPFGSDYNMSKHVLNRLVEFIVLGIVPHILPCHSLANPCSALPSSENPEVKAFAMHPGAVPTSLSTRSKAPVTFDDSVSLSASTMLYITAGKADWLSGRYFNSNWDLGEMERDWKKKIVEQNGLVNKLFIPQ